MKSISGALNTHIQLPQTTMCFNYEITRKDGTKLYVTDHDKEFTFSGNLYKPEIGYTRSAITANDTLKHDAIDITGILNSDDITERDMEAGLWNNARVDVHWVNWQSPADGSIYMFRGNFGRLSWGRTGFEVELKDLAHNLRQTVGNVFSPTCWYDFGGPLCGVITNPNVWQATTAYAAREDFNWAIGDVVRPSTPNGRNFICTTAGTSGGSEPSWNTTLGATTADGTAVWTTIMAGVVSGTLTTVTNARRIFEDSAREGGAFEPDGWYDMGLVTFTGTKGPDQNLNTGLTMDVKIWAAANMEVELLLPIPFDLNVGDEYDMRIGCRRRHDEDCVAKFDNGYRFGGQPYVPPDDLLTRIPDAT